MQIQDTAKSDREISHFIVIASGIIQSCLHGELSIQQAAHNIRQGMRLEWQDDPRLGGELTILRLHTDNLMQDVSADPDEAAFMWSEVQTIVARCRADYSS